MDAPGVSAQPIQRLLQSLGDHTKEGWKHLFTTTNWDYLLEREIDRLSSLARSRWLPESFVFHLNGTVEDVPDAHRSPFLLEEDTAERRILKPEANIAFNHMLCAKVFVVVGMSFECSTDRFLLHSLGREEDWLPVGEALWIVVNRNETALGKSCALIRAKLPAAKVKGVCLPLADWREVGFPELSAEGVLTPACSNHSTPNLAIVPFGPTAQPA
jgi:hypothetical protein